MTARVVPPLPPEVLLTAAEFLTLPDPEAGRRELHDGRVGGVAPAAPRHSVVQGLLLGAVLAWCRAHGAGLPASLESVAAFAGTQGHLERAAHLFGAAATVREAIGAALPPADAARALTT